MLKELMTQAILEMLREELRQKVAAAKKVLNEEGFESLFYGELCGEVLDLAQVVIKGAQALRAQKGER